MHCVICSQIHISERHSSCYFFSISFCLHKPQRITNHVWKEREPAIVSKVTHKFYGHIGTVFLHPDASCTESTLGPLEDGLVYLHMKEPRKIIVVNTDDIHLNRMVGTCARRSLLFSTYASVFQFVVKWSTWGDIPAQYPMSNVQEFFYSILRRWYCCQT